MKEEHEYIKDIISTLPSLREGEQVKTFHCKEGKNNDRLYVKAVENGWVYHCFHCGLKGFVSKHGDKREFLSKKMDKLKKGWTEAATLDSKKVRLPSDFTTIIPLKASSYVSRYLSPDMVKKWRVGWSNTLNRLVVPVYEDGELVCVQYRNIDDDGPKWKRYSNTDWNGWTPLIGESKELVIVEDWISGVKLKESGWDVVILYGTNVQDSLVLFLVRNKHLWDKVVLWLDNDNSIVKLKQTQIRARINSILPCEVCYNGDPKRHMGERA